MRQSGAAQPQTMGTELSPALPQGDSPGALGNLRQTFQPILQQSPRRRKSSSGSFPKTSPPSHLHQSAPRAEHPTFTSHIQTCFAPPEFSGSSTSHHWFPSSMPSIPTGIAEHPSLIPPPPPPTVLPGTGLCNPHPISAAEGTIAVVNNPNSPLFALVGFPP